MLKKKDKKKDKKKEKKKNGNKSSKNKCPSTVINISNNITNFPRNDSTRKVFTPEVRILPSELDAKYIKNVSPANISYQISTTIDIAMTGTFNITPISTNNGVINGVTVTIPPEFSQIDTRRSSAIATYSSDFTIPLTVSFANGLVNLTGFIQFVGSFNVEYNFILS